MDFSSWSGGRSLLSTSVRCKCTEMFRTIRKHLIMQSNYTERKRKTMIYWPLCLYLSRLQMYQDSTQTLLFSKCWNCIPEEIFSKLIKKMISGANISLVAIPRQQIVQKLQYRNTIYLHRSHILMVWSRWESFLPHK